ncbi:MAG: penicillin acylase family protein [Gammaproteobacteria bacterium]|nr:penicillin acylase family protein [Gammaproteobacteria bacterium]
MRRKVLLSLGVVAALVALALLALWLAIRASLAGLEGTETVPGLSAAVTVERDALGVPVIRGQTRLDVARATGYVHAQERFFQMDLMRRASAGELAALVGPAVLEPDRRARRHRFRDVARRVLAAARPDERALLDAYADGVNAGLAALGARPFEYLLLRQAPRAWQAEDSVLTLLAMWMDLQGGGLREEQQLDLLQASLPASVSAFIISRDPAYDAALDDSVSVAAALPTASEYDLRRLDPALFEARPTPAPARSASLAPPWLVDELLADPAEMPGSNNWALAGTHTANGSALVANDMHLGLSVPNTWFRARLVVAGARIDVTGVTLPGVPGVIAGSNGHIAWGFTNSYGDYQDLVVLEPADAKDSYRTPQGPRTIERVAETIEVAGGKPEQLVVEQTIWGPVVGEDARGRKLALAWTAHRPEAINLHSLELESAQDVAGALRIAAVAGIPAQNLVVGDRAGDIAWTVIGQLPLRSAYDARLPSSWSAPGSGWAGWVTPAQHPGLLNPAGGRAWTANARAVGGEMLALIGDGGYDYGARSRQIRDRLATLQGVGPRDFLALHLDDRALYITGWRDRMLAVLDDAAVAGNSRRGEARELLRGWSAHAAVDDAGFLLAQRFHDAVTDRAFDMLTAEVRARWPDFRWRKPAPFAFAAARLVDERPLHLLDPRYADWRDWLLAAADAAIATAGEGCATLADCTWGRANTTRIQHPLSRAVPALGGWLDMPAHALPGSTRTPRVQGPSFGASERFAVSPGHETEGYFHMPGGQSGHPLSPFYRAGHEAWERGDPTPFLPGPAVHTLELRPAG